MLVIGIDIGKSGGIASGIETIIMPTRKELIKEAITVFDLDSKGKKQIYKSGSKKGEFKRKVKSPAKYSTELDCNAIRKLFDNNEPKIVVIETPGSSFGNAARSSATTNLNYGKILACLETTNCEIVKVHPSTWKKDLSLTHDKALCVDYAEKISGMIFRKDSGTLLDGQAEAYLIRQWYINKQKEIV